MKARPVMNRQGLDSGKRLKMSTDKILATNKDKVKRRVRMEIEVNIDEEMVERCTIYEGDTIEDLTNKLARKHKLTEGEKNAIKQQLKLYL